MKLDHRRTQRRRRIELALIGFDEQRHANVGLTQQAHHRREAIVLARRIDAAFGRPLFALLGNDARRMRTMLERDRQHLVGRRHFEIERQVDLAARAAKYRRRKCAGDLRADAP